MILYFADRRMNILGHASTSLPDGFVIRDDLKVEEVETGVASFECVIGFTEENRLTLEEMTEAGNYLLRSHDGENEFYTIMEPEIDTLNQEIRIYAEDAGLDLLNEIVGAFEATEAQTAEWYINKFTADSGFEIGINDIPEDRTRKISWTDDETVTSRIVSIAEKFGGFEVSYSFDIKGMEVTHKYINIFEERGKDTGETLRLDKDIDRIVTTKSVYNLATAFICEGSTPDDSDKPITLSGYEYDDDDFYVDGKYLKCRSAVERWSRHLWEDTDSGYEGHIVKKFTYDTTNQETLCKEAIKELKKASQMEVNYKIDIKKLPPNIKVGDRINIVDDAGELYVSSRVLVLETSVANQEQTATIGEHLIKNNGISQRVEDLANQFAENAKTAEKALEIADDAKQEAEDAKDQADSALQESEAAKDQAEDAKQEAEDAKESADNAQQKADDAQAAVDKVEQQVNDIDQTIKDAEQAAENANQAAQTAQQKAEDAKQAAEDAKADAEEVKASLEDAKTAAESAEAKAAVAESQATQAKAEAEAASATAAAAKLDAEQAAKDIENLGEGLETLQTTMTTDYTRKTEFTEAEAHLQSQISQNSAKIEQTVSQVAIIDETANNAAELAESAQNTAAQAKATADAAKADAVTAQQAADDAAEAAANAQTEADNAKTAAETAKGVADKAEADLEAAKADLATVQGRVDATEEDIEAAQAKVNEAQAAADKAKADAAAAETKAAEAQTAASTAVSNAQAAQDAADDAAAAAAAAQQVADKAVGDAAAAQAKADEAAATAAEAQTVANSAREEADAAQAAADEAAATAAAATQAANDADARAQQAAADLAAAEQRLADVTSRVGATEEEVNAAKVDVEAAKKAAEEADAAAAEAKQTADTAKADAAAAQTAANNAKTAADNAQEAADEAQAAADKAQEDVNALAVRVTTAETSIRQNSEQIELRATKTEVEQTLGGYYTKEQTDAAIQIESDNITSRVSSKIESIEVGGRNLIMDSGVPITSTSPSDYGYQYIVLTPTVLPLIDGKAYSVSADVEVLTGDVSAISVKMYDAELSTQYAEITPEIINGHIEGTFNTVSSSAERVLLYAGIAGNTNGNSVTFSKIKFERGNKATDWTPAPEDVDADISDVAEAASGAQATADAAQAAVVEAQSVIQQLSDSISMLVTDGNGASLMTQTENGWTFSTKELQDSVDNAQTMLSTLQEQLGSAEAVISVLQESVDEHGNTLDYVNIGTFEGEPCIELGESENDLKVIITNTRIMFSVNGEYETYIDAEGLTTGNITVKRDIRQWPFVFGLRSNGNYGVQCLWKEDATWDLASRTAITDVNKSATDPYEFSEDEYYYGIEAVVNLGAIRSSRITACTVDATSASITSSSTYTGIGIPYLLLPGQRYTISASATVTGSSSYLTAAIAACYFDANGIYIENSIVRGSSSFSPTLTFESAPEYGQWTMIILYVPSNATAVRYSNIKLVKET